MTRLSWRFSLILLVLAFVAEASAQQAVRWQSDLEGAKREALRTNRLVLVHYWATWCRPCLAEMPDMDKAAKILGEENFVFLAASDEDMDKIKKFVAVKDYSFQFVHSKTSVFDLDIMALPTTMIINTKGEIVYNEVGARDWANVKELEKLRELAIE